MYLLLAAVAIAVTSAPMAARKCGPEARELALDVERSTIRWRGTKFWELGKHEGTVRLKGGA
jgi:hypothetical protein